MGSGGHALGCDRTTNAATSAGRTLFAETFASDIQTGSYDPWAGSWSDAYSSPVPVPNSPPQDANLHAQFLARFAHDGLFGTFALVHSTAGKGEIMHPVAVTFDEGKRIILDQDGGRAGSHFSNFRTGD
jgi:hypothetical protein